VTKIPSLLKSHPSLGPLLLYLALDTLCVGAGMGVPIFAILIGFAVGWFLPGALRSPSPSGSPSRRKILRAAALLGAYTFALMLIIWGPTLPRLWGPRADLVNFGIPLILYEPTASFIGWELLMIAVSPFLQVLAVVFGADVRLLFGEMRQPDP
jgi:hypothetical protein